MNREADLLDSARKYSFRARMDKGEPSGPIFVKGSGSEVEDIDGRRYLHFNSGQMCAALGHNHPTITAAITEACATMIHAHSSYYNVKEIELAGRLARVMPEGLDKSLFLQSGADANEAAVLIARKFTGGYEVASPHISFHGLSDTARSLTFAGWHADHGPLAAGSYAMVAPYCYRCPLRQTFPSCGYACLDTSFELLDAQATGRPAAVITEPLFSAGGGVSISAVTTTAEIEEKVVSGGFIATHSHSNDPLTCAAGIASLDVIEQEDVPAKARAIGERFKGHLTALAQRYEQIGQVRGRGMLLGIELVDDRESRRPAKTLGQAVHRRCFEQGLIFSQRRGGSVLRFVPPATTTPEQLDRAADILDGALRAAIDAQSRGG